MTQRERILKVLEQGPLTALEVAVKLGFKPNNTGARLSKLKCEGWVEVRSAKRPCVYALTDQKYEKPKHKSHYFDIPHLHHCSRCGIYVDKKTRKLEERPTGPNGLIQVWAFCFSCDKAQEESRKIPADFIIPHISTLAQNAPLFRLRRKA